MKFSFYHFKKPPGVYTIKDILEKAYTMRDRKGTLQIDYDDNSLKKKFSVDLVILSEC